MLIPRIVHQTYRSRQVPSSLRAVMASWTRVNGPGWQTRFYDDEACTDFVRREFPEYMDAYVSLPKDVERSDFFRYMVVLRLGGVYADIDVELRQPLDSIVTPTDTLVVGWEAEVATDAEAFKRHFVRKRQVLQWFFAAAPGHPVLRAACDHIARYARHTFSNNTNRDTLERTGPGMWTDVVLRHAAAHPPTLAGDPWKVRILPRVAFGVHPAGIDGLTPDAKEIVVLHHFLGSWKKRGGWHKRRSVLQIVAGAVTAALRRRSEAAPAEEPIAPSVLPLFPVSVSFSPPFTIMTHLVGQGDMQSGSDVSAVLTSWGTWQAALSRPSRRPLVVEALVGSLGPPEQGAVLVDVSAGQGFFSLAAAARGHTVVAFESSGRSLEAFSAAVLYNGFQDRVRLYNVSLGAAPTTLCLRAHEEGAAAAAAAGAARAAEVGRALQAAASSAAGDAAAAAAGAGELNDAAAAANRRGYGDPAVHSLPLARCAAMTVRQTLAHMLMGGDEAAATGAISPASVGSSDARAGASSSAAAVAGVTGMSLIAPLAGNGAGAGAAAAAGSANASGNAGAPNDANAPTSSLSRRVGALRLSAHGWEGWIMDGAEPWLRTHRPGVVLLEYAPSLVERSGYPGGGLRLLHRLFEMGYVHVAHAGFVCDERWFNISRALRAGGTALGDLASAAAAAHGDAAAPGAGAGGAAGGGGDAQAGAGGELSALPKQPTWCKLKPDLFQLLTDRAHPEVAENILFIHQTHTSVRGEALPAQKKQQEQPSGRADTAAAAQSGSQVPSSSSSKDATKSVVAGSASAGAAAGASTAVAASAAASEQAAGPHLRGNQAGLGRRAGDGRRPVR
ncbi:hypothetical protein HXX76_004613 [Chlamydomonas incerta]|uniref:tRNA(Phe) (4-demethylwyosine(37)-C(7)) aminocarboxypropyltransferase n=1 Tax=Chlamydomonas incerta TaxID=51695 RepID=A0A835T5E5_CHLIN|nr:hypothetical protein HXX76_004613 [Chlamydomonas incerta]|eukprot:KAG2439252.1 hypothetical protein HXX76_004613 [Chlamydomonas incerta]